MEEKEAEEFTESWGWGLHRGKVRVHQEREKSAGLEDLDTKMNSRKKAPPTKK